MSPTPQPSLPVVTELLSIILTLGVELSLLGCRVYHNPQKPNQEELIQLDLQILSTHHCRLRTDGNLTDDICGDLRPRNSSLLCRSVGLGEVEGNLPVRGVNGATPGSGEFRLADSHKQISRLDVNPSHSAVPDHNNFSSYVPLTHLAGFSLKDLTSVLSL